MLKRQSTKTIWIMAVILTVLVMAGAFITIQNQQTESVEPVPPYVISGQVLSRSDVWLFPDIGLANVKLIVVDKAAGQRFIDARTLNIPGTKPLSESEFKSHVHAEKVTNKQGQFSVKLNSGEYVVCLSDTNVQEVTTVFPVTIFECAPLTVANKNLTNLKMSFGLGGLKIEQ